MKSILSLALMLSAVLVSAQSSSMFDICPLKVGAEVPEVSITDASNQEQLITEVIGEQPSVIVFYRGAWCGYCIQHLAELNDARADIESLGYQIFGVTVDQPEKLEISDEKANSEIPVYSDADVAAIGAFGLDWELEPETYTKYKTQYNLDIEAWSGQSHHSLPVPAIYVVKDGIVQFQYVNPNYNTRLPVDALLGVLKTI